jgi:hypothetical protein
VSWRSCQDYPEEVSALTRFAERFTAIGKQRGEATMLLRLLRHKFGDLAETTRQRVETADPDTLLTWSERILTADSIEEVLR